MEEIPRVKDAAYYDQVAEGIEKRFCTRDLGHVVESRPELPLTPPVTPGFMKIPPPQGPNSRRRITSPHGSNARYTNHGCRCEPCRLASRNYYSKKKAKAREQATQ